jgi:hypothetical protein
VGQPVDPSAGSRDQISIDTVLAEYGMLQVTLNAANRLIAKQQLEIAQLRAQLETRQKPDGVPAGSAPRAQRRAADKASSKTGRRPTPLSVKSTKAETEAVEA